MIIVFTILNFFTNVSYADSVSELKQEITRLKNENNELYIKLGEAQIKNADLEDELLEKPVVVKEVSVKRVGVYKRHRVSVLSGISTNNSSDQYVGGVQYQTMLTPKFSVGTQIQTNETILLNLGMEF